MHGQQNIKMCSCDVEFQYMFVLMVLFVSDMVENFLLSLIIVIFGKFFKIIDPLLVV